MTHASAPACAGLREHELLRDHRSEIRTALLVRRTEQRLLGLYAEGKLFGTVHTCIGQEFSAVAVGRALRDDDFVFSNHRGHGHFLATGGTVEELIAEVMGRDTGICRGRGGSQHLQKGRYFSNGIQGGIVPVTAGLALAEKLRGGDAIAVVFIGDGTLGEGAVYETLNIASKWDLPLLVVCENNLFAQSTSQEQTLAGDICARATAFGIETRHDSTDDWPRLLAEMHRSVAFVRESSRPLFHRIDTFRLMAHSKGDDNRPADYVQRHWDKDPLVLLEKAAAGAAWDELTADVDAEIAAAVAAAEAAPAARMPPAPAPSASPAWQPLTFDDIRAVASVRQSLDAALAADPRVFVFGEDVESPYGGAFKCMADLSHRHPGRVRNTPISELAIVGIANGLALGGRLPVVEIMFGDFCTLAMDQWINHAGKFAFMFADKVTMPVVIRTPMGGKRGYGATHSQTLDRHMVGVPGTQVLCLHHRLPPHLLYGRLFAEIDQPTLVIENKVLYGQTVSAATPPGYVLEATAEPFPWVRLRPQTVPDLTVVAIGGVGRETEDATMRLFDEHETIAELFLPSRLYPLDIAPVLDSLRQTRRLLVVEEGQGFASVSTEIIAQATEALGPTGLRVGRMAASPVPIPAARVLEARCLPGVDSILEAAVDLVTR